MATIDPRQLSRREREIMDILYQLGEATAAEVRERLTQPPSYSAVRAMLAKLEAKGQVGHERDGVRYVFSPVLPKTAARDSAMGRVVDTFFGGSVAAAVSNLLGHSGDALSDDDLDRLSARIEAARREREP